MAARMNKELILVCNVKINQVGYFYCIVCSTTSSYGSNGRRMLFKHSKQTNHQKSLHTENFMQTFPGAQPSTSNSSIADQVAD